jgi:hypothetical protein
MLTHLETRPKTCLCSLQLRQRSLYPITPVHTNAEFVKFKKHILDPLFRRNVQKEYTLSQSHQGIDFDQFAQFWNSEVAKQDHKETDSSKRIYYKVPSQLEKYYKKTAGWKATRSTVMMGSNAAALEPLRQLFAKPNITTVLHAQTLPDHCYSEQGKHAQIFRVYLTPSTELFSLDNEFDGLWTTQRIGETIPSEEETHANTNDALTILDHETEDLPAHVSNPSLQPVLAQSLITSAFTFAFSSSSISRTRPTGQKGGRCSVCTKALCPRRHQCNGSVNRAWCMHGHPPLRANEKVRWSEEEVERRILAQQTDT